MNIRKVDNNVYTQQIRYWLDVIRWVSSSPSRHVPVAEFGCGRLARDRRPKRTVSKLARSSYTTVRLLAVKLHSFTLHTCITENQCVTQIRSTFRTYLAWYECGMSFAARAAILHRNGYVFVRSFTAVFR